MINMKIGRHISIALVIAVFAAFPLAVSAKSGNGNDNKPASSISRNVANDENKAGSVQTPSNVKAEVAKPVSQSTITVEPVQEAPKASRNTASKNTASKNTTDKNLNSKKPVVNTGISKQLSQLGKKLSDIDKGTTSLSVEIKAYIAADTTGSAIVTTGTAISTSGTAISTSGTAIATTGSALTTTGTAVPTTGTALTTTGSVITTTGSALITSGSALITSGSAIGTAKNRTAFVNSTTGKLNALSNRLTAAEKSIRALSGKVDKALKQTYDSLVSQANSIRLKLTMEIESLRTLSLKG